MKKLRTFLGPIVREMERKSGEFAIPCVHWLIAKMCLVSELKLAKRVMVQERTSKDKAHKRCEFGVKVGVAVTNRSSFVESGLAFQSNPYYGHSMAIQLIQVERVTGKKPEGVFVERGYRDYGMAEFHFGSEAQCGCETALRRSQHAHYSEDCQDFLRRFMAAVDCLYRVGKVNIVSRLSRKTSICPEIT